MIVPIKNATRDYDAWGSGLFAAPRGKKKHRGRDYKFEAGAPVHAPEAGKIVRIGYPYPAPAPYRYMELLNEDHTILWRFFYVDPIVTPVNSVHAGQVIGYAQDITLRYDQRMANHIHVECIMDPDRFFKDHEGV
jgi:hypothetical protein